MMVNDKNLCIVCGEQPVERPKSGMCKRCYQAVWKDRNRDRVEEYTIKYHEKQKAERAALRATARCVVCGGHPVHAKGHCRKCYLADYRKNIGSRLEAPGEQRRKLWTAGRSPKKHRLAEDYARRLYLRGLTPDPARKAQITARLVELEQLLTEYGYADREELIEAARPLVAKLASSGAESDEEEE